MSENQDKNGEIKLNILRVKSDSIKHELVTTDQLRDLIEQNCFDQAIPVFMQIDQGILELSQIANNTGMHIVDVTESCHYLIDKKYILNIELEKIILSDEQKKKIHELLIHINEERNGI